MPKIMQSVTRLKYNNQFIKAYTPFEVPDEDVEGLLADGCYVLRTAKTKKVSALDSKASK